MGYCLWQQGARLVVCDAGSHGTPQLVQGGRLAEGGRGLHVVDSLAARWGNFRLAGAQAVWCDFGQPLHAADSDAWAWLYLVLSRLRPIGPSPIDGRRAARHPDRRRGTMSRADPPLMGRPIPVVGIGSHVSCRTSFRVLSIRVIGGARS